MTTRFDAIIIGAGQAGPPLAGRLTESGMNVAIVERKLFGGTCVNTGCIPTKAMVASAYAARMVCRAAEYGVEIEGRAAVNLERVMARKAGISRKSREGIEKWLSGMDNCTVFEGHARFISPTEISVGAQRLTAPRIFINAGARAAIPDLPGLQEVPYLTNSSMMDLDTLPRHLIIVGGSYVSLEFGQMFRRFGSAVTILEKGPRLASREDEDVSAAILEIMQNEGIDVRLNAPCLRVEQRGDAIVAHLDGSGAEPEVSGSHLLLATGRRPNTDDLGLEAAGINVDDRGYIPVDDQLRTPVDGIWAMGDCNGQGAFTHTAYNDFEIVAANLLDNDSRRVSDRITAYNIYIDPPLGRVGMTEAQVRESGKEALVGYRPMTKVGRAVEKGETQGFMRVLIDASSKRILGAAILGSDGDEVIHSLLDMMYAKAPYTTMQRAMHIHPTISELVPTMLGEVKPLSQKL